jgi:hypothetical protein
MRYHLKSQSVLALGWLLITTTAMAQIETKLQPLLSGGDSFGGDLALDGDYALIGAAGVQELTFSGAAYFYHFDGTQWVEQARMSAPPGYEASILSFGTSVSMAGDFAVIGSFQDAGALIRLPGTAFVYKRTDDVWTLHTILQASDGFVGDGFGTRVVLQGSRMLVKSDGGVYYFELEADQWIERQKLTDEDFISSIFGFDICLCGDYALMTAHSLDPVSFAADIFFIENGVWKRQVRLLPEELSSVGSYGLALSCDGETAVIAAEGNDDQGTNAGAAYVYARTDQTWTLQTKLYPSNPAPNAFFGRSVLLRGDSLLVSAPFESTVYRFLRTDGAWQELEVLEPFDGGNNGFGSALAQDEHHLIIGASGEDNNAGAAYVYPVEPQVIITTPTGGEAWPIGSEHTLTWDDNLSGTLSLHLLQGLTPLATLAEQTPSDGTHAWQIALPPGSDYRLRIASTDVPTVADTSEAFSLVDNPDPYLVLSAPNGGEVFALGEVVPITWVDNLVGLVHVRLLKAGVVYQDVALSTESDGSYDWQVSDTLTLGCDYGVRVTSKEDTSLKDSSDGEFCIEAAPVPATVRVTSPNGGESWALGSPQTITWATSGIASTDSVQIRLLQDGVSLRILQSKTPNDGSHAWTVPSDLLPNTNYQVRLTWTGNTAIKDHSDAMFTLEVGSDPYIGLLSPNGGEVFPLGETVPITWQDNLSGLVTLRLTKGGVYLRNIRANTPSDGHYDWVVPGDLAPGADYKVRITSVEDVTLKDHSDGFFTLVPTGGPVAGKSGEALPTVYVLEGSYPNPFNPVTVLRYGLPSASVVCLVVYDVLGREVVRLVDAAQPAGWHEVIFDGSLLPSGVYLYRLEAGTFTQSRTMLLVK